MPPDNYASSQQCHHWRHFLEVLLAQGEDGWSMGRAALGDCWGLERLNHDKGLQAFSHGHQHTALPVLFQKVLVGEKAKRTSTISLSCSN